MGRPLRAAEGGYVYHVLNRANASDDHELYLESTIRPRGRPKKAVFGS
jgi:hypothetical protein